MIISMNFLSMVSMTNKKCKERNHRVRVGCGLLNRNLDGSDRRGWIGIYVGWIGTV